jgi:5-oxoprolinase (ATP-hydrolysing)/N-methylhydantoinase B
MAPGGWSGSAEDVNQEALIIPSVRLFAGGQVVEDVKRMILRNVRLPVQLWGDIQAQIASNVVAERRIVELIRRQGRERFDSLVEATLDYSRRRFLLGLEEVEDGVAEAADVIEDDGRGRGPLTIRVRLEKGPHGISVDFAGTDPQAAAPMNSTLACTKAAVICSVIAVVDADIPLNSGLVELIEVSAPRGSLVNPVSPAPAFGATADPSDRVSEAVLRALAQLAPSRVPAGSYSTGNNVTGGGLRPDGSQFLWYSYQAGGCGARPWADGNSAEWHLMANSRNESMEVWETRYPVEFLSFRLLPDSGGPGRFRGGLGTERRVRITQPTRLTGLSDHHAIGAVGVHGGHAGLPNGFGIERDGRRRTIAEEFDLPSPSKFANLPLEPGDVFVSIQGGGGGFGDPRDRDRQRVRSDVEAGYVSPARAADAYGYGAPE